MSPLTQKLPANPALAPATDTGTLPHPGQPVAQPDSTWLRGLMCTVLYAIPAVAAIREVIDPDIWWHLRLGEWIVEHGTLPTTDPFSAYGLDKPWAAYSWLFEMLVHGLYQWLGLRGIVLYRVILTLLVAVAVHRLIARREPRFLVATGLTGLAFLVCLATFNERPWLFTILFTTLTLDAVLSFRQGMQSRWIWLLPIAYVLWANIHIQFVYGLFLLALGCGAPLIDRYFGTMPRDGTAAALGSRAWWQLVALSVVCLLATLLNPYHIRLYAVVLEYATQPGPYRVVVELTPPDFRNVWDWAVLALAGVAAFTLGRRARLSSFEVLLLASTAYFAFHARRDAWFLLLAALAILTAGSRTATADERFVFTPLRVVAIAAGVLLVLALTAWKRHVSEAELEARIQEEFPVAAVAFVEQQGYAGPLYNHFNWGGYLIWRLPRLPVAIDGRTNLHGDARIERFQETWAAVPGWESDPELNAARLVIAHAGMPLTTVLRLSPRFQEVYADPIAAVFVARTPVQQP